MNGLAGGDGRDEVWRMDKTMLMRAGGEDARRSVIPGIGKIPSGGFMKNAIKESRGESGGRRSDMRSFWQLILMRLG